MAEQEYPQSLLQGQEPGQTPAGRTGSSAAWPWWSHRLPLLFLLSLPVLSCSAPDHASRLPSNLPPALGTALIAGQARALAPARGLAYFDLRLDEAPWSIHLLRIELDQCALGLRVLPASPTEGMAGGVSTVSELVGGSGATTVAAVNGDFFMREEGLTSGTEVVAGRVRRVSSRPALAWRPGTKPWMGIPVTEGDSVLVTGWRISRSRADGVSEVLGGFPLLLHGGERVGDLEVTARPAFAAARHPRTAVGFDPSANLLWIVVVDGRQPGHSVGMTLPELVELLERLGVTEALNLDGGGSSVMVLYGVRVSRPSDAEGERAVANSLGVRLDPGLCRPEG